MATERDTGQKEFLQDVLDKIRERIRVLDDTIRKGQEDIAGMHEYYWDNYTEMDQYGYENYDNQQALLGQVNANQENQKRRRKLQRMLDSPYFGRVDFLYEGDEEPETFYIGIGNFALRAGTTPLIYDWRAPVSSLFYDYDRGPASYQAPAGQMDGEVTAKWQYKIRNGKLIYAFESDLKIDDEILRQELGAGGDVKLKNIVRTIQREQNAIIRNTRDRILVIQGAAGSGKTSVALHRIAYLLYHDRKHLKSSNVLVLSPNSVFSAYISHILPELGEENIQEMSFDLFVYRELQDVAADCEDHYDWMEQLLAPGGISPGDLERYRQKQSEIFVGQTEGFLAQLEDRLMDFSGLKWRGMELTDQEIIRLFYFRFQDLPLLARMDAVEEYFVDQCETLYQCTMSEDDRKYLKDRCQKMYVTRDLYVIYNWFLEENGYPMLPHRPLEERKLRYEDVYPLLYLKYRLTGGQARREIKHLVIDEMQDYSWLQYEILKNLFSCSMTILGDREQTLDGEERDMLQILPQIFGRDIRRIELKKSYRNTVEIASYAAGLGHSKAVELFERHGHPVEEKDFASFDQAVEAAAAGLRLEDEEYETAALIVTTEQEALRARALLTGGQTAVNYVDRDSTAFRRGLTVTTFYLAKGLEFDQVFFLDRGIDGPIARQARYIAATRALHELHMYRYSKEKI